MLCSFFYLYRSSHMGSFFQLYRSSIKMITIVSEKDRKMPLENLDELEKLNSVQESWALESRKTPQNSVLAKGVVSRHYRWLRASLMVQFRISIFVTVYSNPAYFQEHLEQIKPHIICTMKALKQRKRNHTWCLYLKSCSSLVHSFHRSWNGLRESDQ